MEFKKAYLVLLFIIVLMAACREAEPTPTPFPEATAVVQLTSTPVPPTATSSPQPTAPPPTPEPTKEPADSLADLAHDDPGVVNITGVVTYTNPLFTLGVAAPVVILEDQAGFVDRNEAFLMPVESQTLGQITSDFFESPFSYNISLPIEPQGTWRDVDNDEEEDAGVQIFAVAYWTNTFGDPFLEERDLHGGGWSTAYASTRISEDAEKEREIVGGKFLVYAPDDQQGFPSGFGLDGLLFTEDDPIVTLSAGYTVVDMDTEPFSFDGSHDQVIDLIEPEGIALVDYSDLTYTEAFDGLIEQLRLEYAFTAYKGIDWDALHERFRPRFEEAEDSSSPELYRRALRDFAWSIPDSHVHGPFLAEDFREAAGGGIGIAIRELDDGRVLVDFLAEGSPADEAGVLLGAEITAVNGVAIDDFVSNTISYFGPYSTAHAQRLHQLLFATRFPLESEVELSYLNPGDSAPQTAKLIASPEFESYNFWFRASERDGFELPVEYELLDNGIGYVQIFSFADNHLLAVQLWERMIRAMNENQVPSLIIDMRQNSGGDAFLADQMAAYFFDEPLVLGNYGKYDEDRGEFYFDPRYEERYYLPAEELRYRGKVVVLVGPDCASACEFFSYDLTLQERSVVVGHYPTQGAGGSIEQVAMPEGENFTFTQGRAVDTNGEIHIEGIGVVPDVRVPLTEETLFSTGDPVLEAAILQLTGNVIDGGEINPGAEIMDALAANARIRYQLALTQGELVSIFLESDTDMVLSFYDEDGNLLGSREGTQAALEDFEVPISFVLVVEVAVMDDAGTEAYTLRVVDADG